MPKRSTSKRVRSAARVVALSAAGPSPPAARMVDSLIGAGLVLLVAVIYAQSLRFQFVNYDDTAYVPDNQHVREGFSWRGIGWAFSTFETANWYPLTWLSLMLDCQLFGPRPSGHHAVNSLLHAANSVLLFIVLKKLTAARWPSAAVAALFAVHPLHVESVAWIAERKDVLSTFFFLLTLLAYQRQMARPSFPRWALVFLGTALGLMAKSMLVTLPAVLLLLDFWWLARRNAGGGTGRKARKSVPIVMESARPLSSLILHPSSFRPLEKLPLLALAVATAAVTVAAQSSMGATAMLYDRAGLVVRLANAAIAYVSYLGMMLWPAELAVYYPYHFNPSLWQAACAGLALLAATVGALACLWGIWKQSRLACRFAPLAVGWLWYVGTLVPVIGLVQVGSQALADRYCYIPSIGIFVAIVWAATDLSAWLIRASQQRRIVLATMTSSMLAAFLVAAHRQTSYWIDSESLFRHALAITGENPVACENLGDALLHQGKYAEAEIQFRKVLAADSGHFRQTPPELAQALEGQGRIGELMAVVKETVAEKEAQAEVLNNLARYLALPPHNHVADAIRFLQRAIELAPENATALRNLAWIYATCPDHGFRDGPRAVELAWRACELTDWKNAACRQTLADAYLESGQVDRAAEELRAVLQLNPQAAAAARQLKALRKDEGGRMKDEK